MTDPQRGFDRVVAIDWSARATPSLGADTLWACWLEVATGEVEVTNHATRRDARDRLVERLVADGGRTLVAIDVALGYPRGFASAARLGSDDDATGWQATWDHVAGELDDGPDNRAPAASDRWAVAARLNERLGEPHFWGVPPARATAHLGTTKPRPLADGSALLDEFRLTEHRLRASGHRPFSVWQLLGAGAVGSQSLTAIPALHHVRHHRALAHRVRIWPFETGVDTAPDADIVIAEAWPSALPVETIDAVGHPVKDARQVIALAAHLAALQHSASLDDLFTPRLTDDEARAVVDEEGWVLGVG